MTDNIQPPIGPNEITNFSQLSPNKFKVAISLFPQTTFWAQRIVLPTITQGANRMGTNKSIVWWDPGDTLEYDDLIVSFMVDEDMLGYRILKKWQEDMVNGEIPEKRFSDLQIILLTNNSNKNLSFKFRNTWPYLITGIMLDTGQAEDAPLTIDVNFKISNFDIDPQV